MRIRLVGVLAVSVAAASAVACSSSSTSDRTTQSTPAAPPSTSLPAPGPVSGSAPSSAGDPASADGGSSAATAPGKPVATKVDKSFTDPVMGDKATIVKMIRNYPVPAAVKAKYSALEDEEVVLVDVKVTASPKYYDTFGADSFYLVGTDGIDDASTTILDDTIAKEGHPPLPDAETGKTTTGWVVFTPDTGRKHLTLRYKRLAATTSDGKTITAKNFDIPLD